MPFIPLRLVSPAGVAVLAGSAIEREQLIHRGYRTPEPEPEPKRPPEKRANRAPAADADKTK